MEGLFSFFFLSLMGVEQVPGGAVIFIIFVCDRPVSPLANPFL